MEQYTASSDDGAAPAAPWTLLGRDNPAGKALFNLYNADNLNGRVTGLQFSKQNRQRFQRQLSNKSAAGLPPGPTTQEPVKKARPKVAVPHFGPKSDVPEVDKLAQVPHRRQGQQILAEMAREQEQAWGHAPQPAGRLLDDEEKQRCALLMQYKGKVPAYEIAAITSSNSRTSKPSLNGRRQHEQGSSSLECGSSSGVSEADGIRLRRQALQQRFTEAAEEVAEREEFIASMQQLGKLQMEHLNVIKAEVAAKVREMGQLHSQIKELDKQLQAV